MVNNLKTIAAAAAAIVSIGSAWVVFERYQPFAWAADVLELAQVSYPTAINQRYDLLLIIQQRLREAVERKDQPAVLALQQQEQRMKQEIDALAERQRRFGSGAK